MQQYRGIIAGVILLIVVASSLMKWRRSTDTRKLDRGQLSKAVAANLAMSVALSALLCLPMIDQSRLKGPLASPLGAALIVAGLPINVLVARALRPVRFVMAGLGTPDRLVTDGPFSVIRHPSSVGIVLILGGWFLVWRSLHCLVWVLPPVVAAVFVENLMEERNLEKVFGDEYRAYKRSVGRYFPRFRRNGGR